MTDAGETREILEATAEALGLTLNSFAVVAEAVSGDGVIRGVRAELTTAEATQVSELFYLETAQHSHPREGVLTFRNELTDDEVTVWLYPKDPELPALPSAVYPEAVGVMLQKMGVAPRNLSLALVAYRPGKRAVVRVTTAQQVVFLKVMRPALTEALHGLYRLWREAGVPVPETLGWSTDGLIGFETLPGTPASDAIDHLGARFLEGLESLTDEIQRIPSTSDARASLTERSNWYSRRVTVQHPELAAEVQRLTCNIDAALAKTSRPAPVTVHGDLHIGQLFVAAPDSETITGILDIDTAGLGDPADDAGAFYAHLVVSALFDERHNARRAKMYMRLASEWRERWISRSTPADPHFSARAHAVAAAHLLAHTLGGFVPASALIAHAHTLV